MADDNDDDGKILLIITDDSDDDGKILVYRANHG